MSDAASKPDRLEPALEGIELPKPPPDLGQETTPEILPDREPFRKALHSLSLIEQGIGVLLLLAILVLVLIQVGQRYVPGTGLPATGELARLCMVWVTFVLSGYLMAHDRHIAIRVIDFVLPVRAVGVIQLLGDLFVALTCFALVYAIYDLILNDRGQVTAAAQLPLTWIYAVALLGLASTALRALVAVFTRDLGEIRGQRPSR